MKEKDMVVYSKIRGTTFKQMFMIKDELRKKGSITLLNGHKCKSLDEYFSYVLGMGKLIYGHNDFLNLNIQTLNQRSVLNGECTHLFLSDEKIRDVIEESKGEPSEEGFYAMLQYDAYLKNPELFDLSAFDEKDRSSVKIRTYVLHRPNRQRSLVATFGTMFYEKENMFVNNVFVSDGDAWLNGQWPRDYIEYCTLEDKEDALLAQQWVNLTNYLLVFPCAIKDEAPKYRLLSGSRSASVKEVTLDDSLAEDSVDGVPHYRHGHFAYLKAERYKKKRFCTVFKRACFVSGRAKSVEYIGGNK